MGREEILENAPRESNGEEETAMYKCLLLIQAISSIKVADMSNNGSGSANLARLQLREGSTLPPNLLLAWTYPVYDHPSTDNPRVVSTILETWESNLSRVTITTTLHDSRGRHIFTHQDKDAKLEDDPHPTDQPAPLPTIRGRLLQSAKVWTTRLVHQGFTLTKRERECEHWSGSEMFISTLEVVDCKTRLTKLLEILPGGLLEELEERS
jgi:hypothetical protein